MKSFVIFSIVLAVSFAFPTEGDDSQHVDLVPQKNDKFRIAGGLIAKSKQFPYHVRLELARLEEGKTKVSLCGGSLISNKAILTAAHCLEGRILASIHLGSTTAISKEPTHTTLYVFKKDFRIHEKYNSTSFENDIGLILLTEPVQINDGIQIVNLPPATLTNLDHNMGIISGFGRTGTNERQSNELRFAFRRILPNMDCLKRHPAYFKPEVHVCVDGSNNISNCRGDSGGPLVISQKDGTKAVVALTSFAKISCDSGISTISTRVTKYLSWIQKHTGIPIRD